MARFLRKKTGLIWGLIFFWGFYFFSSPFMHYHPNNSHAYAGELRAHYHEGHFYSQELEALAHAWNFHPTDKQQDKKRHHPHSSPGHDSDKYEVNIQKAGLKHKNPAETAKQGEFLTSLFPPQSLSHQIKEFFLKTFHPVNDPNPFQERSPPYFFV